jgi:hypothetical protein
MKTPRSDKWLTDYSGEHLLHELKMFWWLAGNIKPDMDAYLHDALLASSVVHLRNLVDFFYRAGQDDDVVAKDFFDKPCEWSANESTLLNSAHTRANKELSHLTAARKNEGDPEKPWDLAALHGEISAVAKDFANRASKTKLHEKVREFMKSTAGNVVLILGEHSHSTNTVSRYAIVPDVFSGRQTS